MTIVYDEKGNSCYQCQHYNSTFDLCHLRNLFGYCDFKPISKYMKSENNKEMTLEERFTPSLCKIYTTPTFRNVTKENFYKNVAMKHIESEE